MMVLAVISGLIWRARRQRPYLVTGWLWYLGMLVPVVGLVQVGSQAMADRFTYLPLIGVFIGVVFGLGDLAKKLRLEPMVMILIAGIVLAGCLFATVRQLQYWRDSETLFERALAVTKDNPVAQTHLGTALSEAGQLPEAMEHFREALRLEPGNATAHNNLGHALLQTGQPQAAMEHFQEALRLKPDSPVVQNDFGYVLLQKGQVDEAIAHFQVSIKLQPNNPRAYSNLGWALLLKGHMDEAMAQFQKALEIQPRFATGHFNLGVAFDRKGQVDKAIEQYQEAVDLQPDFVQARNNLGDALLRTGRTDGAVAQFQEALKIWPNSTILCNNLGRAFLHKGQVNEAMAQFQKTLELQPNNVDACRYLAWVLATCPEPSIRNGAKAVELAREANQLSGGGDPEITGTLAAAYAEAGRFPDAMTTAQKALALATAQTNTAVADALQTQIKCYQAGSPFRDRSSTNTQTTTQ